MNIQGRAAFIAVGLALLLILLALAGRGWLREHDARLKAESLASQQQKQLDGLKQQETETQQALTSKIAGIERERAQPVSAAQMVSAASALIPDLPQALRVQEFPSAVPDGPPTQAVVIPEGDFRSIRDAQLTCEEDSAKLTACLTLQTDAKQELVLTEAQREEWKTAAKGGSVWHRALGAAKWFAVGAASGAVVYAIGHHR